MSTTELDLAHAASAFHALSDRTRLELVQFLMGGERCVCELQEGLGAAQSRLSFHLKTLKDAGLVTDRRDGRWVYYALDLDALGDLASLLSEVRARGAECCADDGCCS
ncbi:MAG: metalloregulator ArsR/SmtB family transcription factor [Gemmatimonadetes bacterium]|nr:metalloregulator ArsR/SmtB family transcription factor [Gemmatimonadota bacterium]